jgi:hypothetical protein
MSEGSNHLDPNRPDAVRRSVGEARVPGEAALARIGYSEDNARIVTDQLNRSQEENACPKSRCPKDRCPKDQ